MGTSKLLTANSLYASSCIEFAQSNEQVYHVRRPWLTRVGFGIDNSFLNLTYHSRSAHAVGDMKLKVSFILTSIMHLPTRVTKAATPLRQAPSLKPDQY